MLRDNLSLTPSVASRKLLFLLTLSAALSLQYGGQPALARPALMASASRLADARRVPVALRAAVMQARQREAGPEHAVVSAGSALLAQNPEHGIAVALDRQGIRLHSTRRHDAPWASFALTHYGCASAPRSARPIPPTVAADKNRVEYARDGMTEWYLNGPLGIEQGFTVERDPGCGKAGRLALAMELRGGLVAAQAGQGAATHIELRDRPTGSVMSYSDLFAFDAEGRELPARLKLSAGKVVLEVDAAEARYPVTVDPLWQEQATLIASDGAANDDFGAGVALSGNTAIVGAFQRMVGNTIQQGQAYVYVRTGTTWTQQATLTASDGAALDAFGSVMALDGDTALVGVLNANGLAGKAYVYVRTGTTWTEQARLTASDGAAAARFGCAVALSGNTALIGSYNKTIAGNATQGEAYVYVRAGTLWTEQAKLTASDGAAKDFFGEAVALSGDTALVGADGKTVGGNAGQGEAYVYTRSGTLWTQQAKLIAADGVAGDRFGYAVALSGGTALIDSANKVYAYVQAQAGAAWTEQAKLTPSGGLGGAFNSSLALSGDTALIGAFAQTIGANRFQGEAYVFTRSGTAWTEQTKLILSNGAAFDKFGASVALNQGTALIGAASKSVGGNPGQGQAFVYLALGPNGAACKDGSQCASSFCVDGLCCDTSCGGGVPTDCQSCRGADTAGPDGSCGPVSAAAQLTCRPAASECDAPELCDGQSTTCPADSPAADNTPCSAGVCQAGMCTAPMPAGGRAGCDCHLAPTHAAGASGLALAASLSVLMLLMVRRRCSRGVRS